MLSRVVLAAPEAVLRPSPCAAQLHSHRLQLQPATPNRAVPVWLVRRTQSTAAGVASVPSPAAAAPNYLDLPQRAGAMPHANDRRENARREASRPKIRRWTTSRNDDVEESVSAFRSGKNDQKMPRETRLAKPVQLRRGKQRWLEREDARPEYRKPKSDQENVEANQLYPAAHPHQNKRDNKALRKPQKRDRRRFAEPLSVVIRRVGKTADEGFWQKIVQELEQNMERRSKSDICSAVEGLSKNFFGCSAASVPKNSTPSEFSGSAQTSRNSGAPANVSEMADIFDEDSLLSTKLRAFLTKQRLSDATVYTMHDLAVLARALLRRRRTRRTPSSTSAKSLPADDVAARCAICMLERVERFPNLADSIVAMRFVVDLGFEEEVESEWFHSAALLSTTGRVALEQIGADENNGDAGVDNTTGGGESVTCLFRQLGELLFTLAKWADHDQKARPRRSTPAGEEDAGTRTCTTELRENLVEACLQRVRSLLAGGEAGVSIATGADFAQICYFLGRREAMRRDRGRTAPEGAMEDDLLVLVATTIVERGVDLDATQIGIIAKTFFERGLISDDFVLCLLRKLEGTTQWRSLGPLDEQLQPVFNAGAGEAGAGYTATSPDSDDIFAVADGARDLHKRDEPYVSDEENIRAYIAASRGESASAGPAGPLPLLVPGGGHEMRPLQSEAGVDDAPSSQKFRMCLRTLRATVRRIDVEGEERREEVQMWLQRLDAALRAAHRLKAHR